MGGSGSAKLVVKTLLVLVLVLALVLVLVLVLLLVLVLVLAMSSPLFWPTHYHPLVVHSPFCYCV